MKAKELPRRLQAAVQWQAERIGKMSRTELAALHAERVQEVEEELRGGAWGHALRAAMNGDASKLALHLTRGRVPLELADLVYRVIVAAPWRDQKRGRPRRLDAMDEIGVRTIFMLEHRVGGRARDAVLDELVHRYGVSRSSIERAVAGKGGTTRNRTVTKEPFVKARARK